MAPVVRDVDLELQLRYLEHIFDVDKFRKKVDGVPGKGTFHFCWGCEPDVTTPP